MKWLNGNRMRLVVVGFVAAIVLGDGSARADFSFGEPVNLGPTVNTSYNELTGCFSADGLEMYLSSTRRPTTSNWDIWVSKRETIDDEWGAPVNLGPPVNIGWLEMSGYISPDGLELYFHAWEDRPGGYGDYDLWITSRATTDDPWGVPVNLGPTMNSSYGDRGPSISPDGLELYFASSRPGGHGSEDIWVSRRGTTNDPWGEPTNLGPVVNSSASDESPSLSYDGRLLLFNEDKLSPLRPGGYGGADIWMTRRASISDPWGNSVNLGPIINSPSNDARAVVSPDGSTLYFTSARPGGLGGTLGDIYQAPIIPIVDFNGDEIVDIDDLVILIEHWGTSESLCDIGPMPWGDGTVDEADLKVLMGYWGQEAYDPTLIAHWKLDETEGNIAPDSAGDNDATLSGRPLWQPEGGMVDGAITFDEIDDYISTEFVLNPADGMFSALAWVKGGAPGQVILSQANGAGWLCTDSVEGNLMTELKVQGRHKSLLSQTFLSNGTWHHIGLVWDGSYRRLYVDGVEVAIDAVPLSGLESADGGLYIGAGSTLGLGTFWSGLIDDVRIYNRAIIP